MASQKPSIPKGTRDFSPIEMARRNYLFDTLKRIFRKYGFAPIETPTMENLSTLIGKYGDEGDKLLFKVLNSGDFLKGVDSQKLPEAAVNPNALATKICEKGLRYDLTVPLARYVVQHRGELTLPFKRYQIQPVWRADRPQKGRYREFYQCDVDSIGSASLLNELELIQIVEEVFATLGIRVVLKINNRKILYGIAQTIGFADKMVDITVAIDKLDKIGIEAVEAELLERGLTQEAIGHLRPILELTGTNRQKLAAIRETIGSHSAEGLRGIDEITTILDYTDTLGVTLPIELDLSLARGLNYYTGAIFEVKALDYPMGSISGGGRYDDLTGIFGLADTSGVGISFGADRIYDVLLGLDLFPQEATVSTRAMFVNFGGTEELEALRIMKIMRQAGIACEIYPEADKLKKQFDYATRRAIPYMIFVGETEIATGSVTIKNLNTSTQQTIPQDKIADALQ